MKDSLIPAIIYEYLPKSSCLWYFRPLIESKDLIVFCTSEKLHRLCLRGIDQSKMIGDRIACGSSTIHLVHSSIDDWAVKHGQLGDALISLYNEKQLEIV